MRKTLSWSVGILAGSLLVVAAGWTLSRLNGPTEAQRAAIAILSEVPSLQGSNAFPTLWQLPDAIPESDRASAFAADLRRWGLAAPWGSSPSGEDRGHPPAITREERARFCNAREDCLEKVAADPAGYAALLARHADLLDRIEGLSAHAGIRTLVRQGLYAPLPDYGIAGLLRTRHAMAFVQGHADAAFEGVCRDIATWRRLGADSDSYSARIVGSGLVNGELTLFAGMLARVPLDQPMPGACNAAFAPPAGPELSMCGFGRGEFGRSRQDLDALAARGYPFEGLVGWPRWTRPLAHDPEATIGELAAAYLPFCDDETSRALREDRVPRERVAPSPWRFECLADAIGCDIIASAYPEIAPHAARVEDVNAHLRLVAALLRLREDRSDTRPLGERLEAMHAAIGAPARRIVVDDDGRGLCLDNYSESGPRCWKIPLPPHFATQTPASPPSR